MNDYQQKPYEAHYGPDDESAKGYNPSRGLLEKAQRFLPGKDKIDEIRQELEGPKPLRVIAGLCGLGLAITSALGLINIFALLSHPPRFLLQVYEALFGLMIAVVELKAFFKQDNYFRNFCYKWFPFLSILAGKGIFYVFAGMGFGWTNLLVFVPACAVLAMGVIYILFHFGRCTELREKYDQTVVAIP